MTEHALLALLQLADPMLPIGGFAHSSGLETYVQQKVLRKRADVDQLLRTLLRYNLGCTDGSLLSLAFDAALQNDWPEIEALHLECDAAKPASETRNASRKLGLRLLKLFVPLYPLPLLQKQLSVVGDNPIHYCVVFGAIAALAEIPKKEALAAFYYNAAAGLVTNCVKLVPLGQQEGQEILFGLRELLAELTVRSLDPDRSLIGLSCAGADIRCMQHEFLYSRLYMS